MGTGAALIALLEPLEFKSDNTAYQPVIEALGLIRRYAKRATPPTTRAAICAGSRAAKATCTHA
ncbi:hypothetical protein [Nonomuraea fuscirosea]|uniref:hypothetical protein n=1 Tax=Nonomuraea fuscirosea TaxID=1291556 RepID=UPI0034475F7D